MKPFLPVARVPAWLDRFTGVLLCAMLIFAPWAFGCTQPWAMQAMNYAGYGLGFLWIARLLYRRASDSSEATMASSRKIRIALGVSMVLILAYCLVAAWNAEFTYVAAEWRLDPHPHVDWLPHSLDRLASWRVFWNWLALSAVFWAAHDWLTSDFTGGGYRSGRRLRVLIYVLAVNGALVACEGILQRSSGTNKLLWFQATRENAFPEAQFGPYAYRSNAAQFFNLVWPVVLGLWWRLHLGRATAPRGAQRHHWLLPCVMLLVAAPLLSMSRAGAALTLLQILACGGVFLASRNASLGARLGLAGVGLLTLGAAAFLGGDELTRRFRDTATDPFVGRRDTYQLAARMAQDYPLFGVGPGAFDSVFQVYRNTPKDYWPAQLHNDWLEYRITFGYLGCALILLAGVIIALRWTWPGGIREPWSFVACLWIALGGCLLHARVDFPFQIYSIQFVFVLLCAILFSVSRAARRTGAG